MKKIICLLVGCFLLIGLFAACIGCNKENKQTILKVGVVKQSQSIDEAWNKIKSNFELIYKEKGYKVEFFSATNIEEGLKPMFDRGDAPDILFLPTGRDQGFAEELIESRSVIDLSNLLEKKVYNEDVKLKDKFIKGFLDTLATNVYQDSLIPDRNTYMLPLFYEPYGFFYNQDLFNDRGTDGKYKLPDTYDSFLNLRYKLDEINVGKGEEDYTYLFGYGNSSKLKSLAVPTFASFAGKDLAEKMLSFDSVFENEGFVNASAAMEKINQRPEVGGGAGNYVYKPSMAGSASIQENQSAFLNNKILFVPGGNDFYEEMKDNSAFENFNFGFMACPSATKDAQRYIYTDMEQIYILNHTTKLDVAEDFLLYLFSDDSANIFSSTANKILPTDNAVKIAIENGSLNNFQKMVYDCFKNGERPIFGQFKKVPEVGINWENLIITNLSNMFQGIETRDSYLLKLKENAVKMRAALLY